MVKNKRSPFQDREFDILYAAASRGWRPDRPGHHAQIIDKSGAWFSYGETRLGQGRENVRQFLEQNADLAREIEASCAASSV